MKLNNSRPTGWLFLFLPAFPSHIPAVGNVGRFLHQYMLLFSDTIMMSLEAWDKVYLLWYVIIGPILSFL